VSFTIRAAKVEFIHSHLGEVDRIVEAEGALDRVIRSATAAPDRIQPRRVAAHFGNNFLGCSDS